MTHRPDSARSRAVLVGVGDYTHNDLPGIPAAATNITDLHLLLTFPAVGSFVTEHCVMVSEPSSGAEIGAAVRAAARQATDVLLVYYAGHGLLDRRGRLHLAVTNSDPDQVGWTALAFETLREEMLESSANTRILILDCCFSGRAFEAMSAVPGAVFGQVDIRGTYTIVSSSANETSFAPVGHRHTAFTAALLSAASTTSGLTLDELYRSIDQRLLRSGYPRPRRRSVDSAGALVLFNKVAAAEPLSQHRSEHAAYIAPEFTWLRRSRTAISTCALVLLAALSLAASVPLPATIGGRSAAEQNNIHPCERDLSDADDCHGNDAGRFVFLAKVDTTPAGSNGGAFLRISTPGTFGQRMVWATFGGADVPSKITIDRAFEHDGFRQYQDIWSTVIGPDDHERAHSSPMFRTIDREPGQEGAIRTRVCIRSVGDTGTPSCSELLPVCQRVNDQLWCDGDDPSSIPESEKQNVVHIGPVLAFGGANRRLYYWTTANMIYAQISDISPQNASSVNIQVDRAWGTGGWTNSAAYRLGLKWNSGGVTGYFSGLYSLHDPITGALARARLCGGGTCTHTVDHDGRLLPA